MIKICDGWYYIIEESEYTLIHEYEKVKGVFGKPEAVSGETVTKREEIGYFQTLREMLKRLAKIMCKEKQDAGEITTIGEHIEALEKLEEDLNSLVKGK